jgi:hypothetical protein
MNLHTLAIALCLSGAASLAAAQTAAAPKPAPAKAAAAKSAKPAAVAPAAAPVVLAQASPEQLEAAARAHVGDYECEFNQHIDVAPSARAAGYLDVKHDKQSYTMKPLLSSTGALRLEDVKGQMLLLQIANKSMLMDTKAGRRVVDGCVHASQRAAAATAAAGGGTALLSK